MLSPRHTTTAMQCPSQPKERFVIRTQTCLRSFALKCLCSSTNIECWLAMFMCLVWLLASTLLQLACLPLLIGVAMHLAQLSDFLLDLCQTGHTWGFLCCFMVRLFLVFPLAVASALAAVTHLHVLLAAQALHSWGAARTCRCVPSFTHFITLQKMHRRFPWRV